MSNTRIYTLYRCASNYKHLDDVVIAGDGTEQINQAIEKIDADRLVIPALLGLPACYPFDADTGEGFDEQLDHPFVALDCTSTLDAPTEAINVSQLLQALADYDATGYQLPFQR